MCRDRDAYISQWRATTPLLLCRSRRQKVQYAYKERCFRSTRRRLSGPAKGSLHLVFLREATPWLHLLCSPSLVEALGRNAGAVRVVSRKRMAEFSSRTCSTVHSLRLKDVRRRERKWKWIEVESDTGRTDLTKLDRLETLAGRRNHRLG